VIQEENNLRALIGIPLRADHRGGCFTDAQAAGLCANNPNTGLPTAPGTTSGTTKDTCVVTTAATGGPDSSEGQFLRWVRDAVFQQTRWGRRFLAQVHNHYYRFGPPIAKEMFKDDALREAVEWAVVSPLVNYYRLVWTRPEWNLDDCPSPLKEYLEALNRDMDCWLSKIELPREFKSLSPEEAAIELSVVLRFILEGSSARCGYLQELTDAHALPLYGSRDELALANVRLIQSDIPEDERVKIVGDAALLTTIEEIER